MLEGLSLQLKQPLVLIELGPDDTQDQVNHFNRLKEFCPHVTFIKLGGEKPASDLQKYQSLSAADLAISLVDNVQETFGLSVAEAMSAGLPIVASDWDGYRDSVRSGIDGFLVPTFWSSSSDTASTGLGWLHQLGVVNYPAFAGALAQLVQVDMDAASAAIMLLLNDPLLKSKMGAAASSRALERFNLDSVSKSYTDLFDNLEEERILAQSDPRMKYLPNHRSWLPTDPVQLFESFASGVIPPSSPSFPSVKPPSEVLNARSGLWDCLHSSLTGQNHGQLEADLLAKHK